MDATEQIRCTEDPRRRKVCSLRNSAAAKTWRRVYCQERRDENVSGHDPKGTGLQAKNSMSDGLVRWFSVDSRTFACPERVFPLAAAIPRSSLHM